MAAGKSTVGRLLADELGWEFVDFDDLVRGRTGLPAGSLIRERGEASLRALESELTDELAGRRDVVLAPGGGWATRPELSGRLGPGTVRIWLRVSAAEAVRRASVQGEDRPLLGHGDDEGVGDEADGDESLRRAEALLAEREPLYAAAEAVVDVDGKEPETVALEILRHTGLKQGDDER
jgi:shikimate kinase